MKKFLPKLQFSMYLDCLEKICHQIGLVDTSEFRSEASYIYLNPGDSILQKSAKEVQAMEKAKFRMSRLLHGNRILLILDDVWDNGDCDWFDFNFFQDRTYFQDSRTSRTDLVLFVTTRTDDDFRFSGLVNINMNLLSEEQAFNLFFMEAGAEPSPQLSSSDYALALDIVRKCGFLPIAVKTAGRLFRYGLPDGTKMELKDLLKHVVVVSTPERAEYLENYEINDEDRHSIQLFHILDRSFAMVMSESLQHVASLFLAAFSVVFSQDAELRPWVPYGPVKVLWKQLIASNSFNTISHKVMLISVHEILEGLRKIGVIHVDMSTNLGNIEDRKYRISHDLMWQYGRQCASLLNQQRHIQKQIKPFPKLASFKSLKYNQTQVEGLEDSTKIEWNGLIADQYKVIIDEPHKYENIEMISIALQTLPYHMMCSLQLNAVFSFLVDKTFVKDRLSILGVEQGVKRHIADIEKLHGLALTHDVIHSIHLKKNTEFIPMNFCAIYCFNFLADTLWEMNSEKVSLKQLFEEIHRALMQAGRALQKYTSFNDAIDCFFKALDICRVAGYKDCHIDIVQILKLIEYSSLRKVVLVSITSPNRLILKNSKTLEQQKSEEVLLELSSHPGYSISPMFGKFSDSGYSLTGPFLEVVLGPKENGILATYDGTHITRLDDGAELSVAFGMLKQNFGLNLKPGPRTPGDYKSPNQNVIGSRAFIINQEGSISPARAPYFALGIPPYPDLRLVKRNSPNRAIFKNSKLLREIQLTSYFSENENVSDDIGLELLSHPGFALVPMGNEWLDTGRFLFIQIGLGPNQEKLLGVFTQDGQIISRNNKANFMVNEGIFREGQPLGLVKYDWTVKNKGDWGYCQYFSMNIDGSISPMKAPHLAFGFYVPA
eukprot:CAMPEP_0194315132 /NCGR_PEP_ID=MMETSP0171-20130528/11937_1 /TAXON_ID=218684 /ORGANISM="Corethron pennatum, Strain L29A3" /LENGTH=886 /DNA_ID=CAMNT_0039070813 /DNA_START=513 /DNA_END=3169 /DNA_ORIENTATION=+